MGNQLVAKQACWWVVFQLAAPPRPSATSAAWTECWDRPSLLSLQSSYPHLYLVRVAVCPSVEAEEQCALRSRWGTMRAVLAEPRW